MLTVERMSPLVKNEEPCFFVVFQSSDRDVMQELKHKGMTQAGKREIMIHNGLEELKLAQEGKKEVLAKVIHENRGRLMHY